MRGFAGRMLAAFVWRLSRGLGATWALGLVGIEGASPSLPKPQGLFPPRGRARARVRGLSFIAGGAEMTKCESARALAVLTQKASLPMGLNYTS